MKKNKLILFSLILSINANAVFSEPLTNAPISCDQIKGEWKGGWKITPRKGPPIQYDVHSSCVSYREYSYERVIMNLFFNNEEIDITGICVNGKLDSFRSNIPNISAKGMIVGNRIILNGALSTFNPESGDYENSELSINLDKE